MRGPGEEIREGDKGGGREGGTYERGDQGRK